MLRAIPLLSALALLLSSPSQAALVSAAPATLPGFDCAADSLAGGLAVIFPGSSPGFAKSDDGFSSPGPVLLKIEKATSAREC